MCVDGEQLQTHINSVRLGVGRERLGIGKLGIASGSLDEHARQAGEIGGEGVDDGIIVWVPRQIRGCAAKGAVDCDSRRQRVGGRPSGRGARVTHGQNKTAAPGNEVRFCLRVSSMESMRPQPDESAAMVTCSGVVSSSISHWYARSASSTAAGKGFSGASR